MPLGDKLAGNASASAVKAGEAFFEVNADDSGVIISLKRMANRITAFGGLIRNIGVGSGALGAAVLAPITALFASAVNDADNIQELSERWGETAEAISKVSYAAKLAGVNFDDLKDGVKTLDQAMHAALDGSGKHLLAFENMGIDAQEFVNIPIDEKLKLIANGFDQIENPLERSQYLLSLFGEKAKVFAPLVGQGAAEVQRLFEEAERTGAITTSEQAKQASVIKDSWDKTLTSIKRTLFEVGAAFFGFSGSIEETTDSVLKNLANVRLWIQQNKTLIVTIAAVSAGLIGGGLALTVLGTAISGVVTALLAVKTIGVGILTVVLAPITLKLALLTAGFTALGYVLLNLTDTGLNFQKNFSAGFDRIKADFGLMWSGILAALKSGDLHLAGQIALTGLELAWKETNLMIMKTQKQSNASISSWWTEFKSGFEDLMDQMSTSIAKWWIGLTGIIAYGLASITDELGITTDKAKKVLDDARGQFRAVEDARKQENNRIVDENIKKQQQLAIQANDDIKRTQKEIDDLRKKLNGLAGQAKALDPARPDLAHMAEKELAAKMEMRLGDAVRGAFGARDYAGMFALGPANDYAKKNNEELKKIKDELVKLNRKPGLLFQ